MSEGIRIGDFGKKFDIELSQGEEFPLQLLIRNPSTIDPDTGLTVPGTPINLTDCSIAAQIRRNALDPSVLAVFAVDIFDPEAGRVRLVLSSASSRNIPVGETLKDRLSKAVWDLWLTDSLGRPLRIFYGDVTILRRVTRLV